jgi:Domain of Unknown Function (DUF748)
MLAFDSRAMVARGLEVSPVRHRRWLFLVAAVLLVVVAVSLYWLPEIVRRVAIARVHALTGRPVAIERVDVSLLRGRFTVHGFRLMEPDGQTPLADFQRLDLRVNLPSFLIGHVWIREMTLSDSTVRVVRQAANVFNVSDLIRGSGGSNRPLDVTVDHFVLARGTVVLEDRALPQPRTWTSERITIDARNVSTRRSDGRASGSAVTAGATTTVDVKNLRLAPIHVDAVLAVQGLDLTVAQIYLPPDRFLVDRGRANMSITATVDASDGIRADATGQFADVAVLQPDGRETIAAVPQFTTRVTGFGFRDGALRLGMLALDGSLKVRDPLAKRGDRMQHAEIRGNIADLSWPATTPGRIDIVSTIQGGGELAVTGTLDAPPAPSRLRLRLAKFDVTPWAQLIPIAGRVSGVAEGDLRIDEPLAAGIPTRVQGSVAVNRLGIADANGQVMGAQRIEASGLEIEWPKRIGVTRVLVSGPRGIVERTRAGDFPLRDILRPAASRAPSPTTSASRAQSAVSTPPLVVEVGEIVIRDGAVAWRDLAVTPPARLDVANMTGRLTGVGWPLHGPVGVQMAVRPPGGGDMRVSGRVALEPLGADLRVVAHNADLAPYRPYMQTSARLSGAADLDLAVVVPSLAEPRGTARGSLGLSRLDVRDSERTVMRVERALATSVDVDWPARVDVGRLALTQPWLLLERDEKGGMPLRTLLPASSAGVAPAASGATGPSVSDNTPTDTTPTAITVKQISVERGGMRIVDRAVSPPFAVDLRGATAHVQDLGTATTKPARLDVNGEVGSGSALSLRGTLGALGGPLKLNVNGELREFAVPRANPYVLEHAGWKSTAGRLTTTLQCTIDGDALSAKTNIRLSQLRLVRATEQDGAQSRIGLPLGMLTSLMKNKRGDINVSLPVGGRLNDPRFEFREAIWSAVRSVAINAIALPVSWIGRVHFSQDSRIERIEVDPLPFEPGTPTLTAEGRARLTRVAAFLEQLPEVKMAVTPVISAQDISELKRQGVLPDTPETDRDDGNTKPPAATTKLAKERVDVVRSTIKEAGIDGGRLTEMKLVRQDDRPSQVALNVVEPETPRPSKVRDTIDRLRGLITGDAQD